MASVLFAWREEDVASLQWPGREPDGRGVQRLFAIYAAFLLASMVWIDLTRLYIEAPSTLGMLAVIGVLWTCLLYTSPSPRDRQKSRMPSSA